MTDIIIIIASFLIPVSLLTALYCFRKLVGLKTKATTIFFILFILFCGLGRFAKSNHLEIEAFVNVSTAIISIISTIITGAGAFVIYKSYRNNPQAFVLKMQTVLQLIGALKVVSNNLHTKKIVDKFERSELTSITWNEMFLMNTGQKYKVSDKIEIKKVEQYANKMVWFTTIKAGGRFGKHLHTDCIETCYVKKGNLIDDDLNINIKRGQKVTIKPNVAHTPYSTKDTELIVTFERK